MKFSTMKEWLFWINSIHNEEIELGIERVKKVASELGVLKPNCPVIIVGGTNGKGSTVAGLEAIYQAAGYQTGAFTSPILFKHNEQVRINGQLATDAEFCTAFNQIESARGKIPLTSFEFQTLAALIIFAKYPLDVWILEVGLGGRLDAVNIIDADVAVVTSISLDHTDWLGPTRETIGFEKAGIFRPHRPAVSGDFDPPQSLINYASSIGTRLFCQGQDFYFEEQPTSWSWKAGMFYEKLPIPRLNLQNMSTVLMVITLLQNKLPVERTAIDAGLIKVSLPGRLQVINEPIIKIFDVSHNPAAVALLAKRLKEISCLGKTFAVFSMLSDKDILESIKTISPFITEWFVAPLTTKRAASSEQLKNAFKTAEINKVNFLDSIQAAYQAALHNAKPGDRVVIFGSFHTVADVWDEQS